MYQRLPSGEEKHWIQMCHTGYHGVAVTPSHLHTSSTATRLLCLSIEPGAATFTAWRNLAKQQRKQQQQVHANPASTPTVSRCYVPANPQRLCSYSKALMLLDWYGKH
jgi:hypothetical protein